MLAQNAFTLNDLLELALTPLDCEMAVISEWVVCDERDPDNLLTVFVSPMSDGHSLQTACSCPRGIQGRTCPHALVIIKTFHSHWGLELREELFRRKAKTPSATTGPTPKAGINELPLTR